MKRYWLAKEEIMEKQEIDTRFGVHGIYFFFGSWLSVFDVLRYEIDSSKRARIFNMCQTIFGSKMGLNLKLIETGTNLFCGHKKCIATVLKKIYENFEKFNKNVSDKFFLLCAFWML